MEGSSDCSQIISSARINFTSYGSVRMRSQELCVDKSLWDDTIPQDQKFPLEVDDRLAEG